MENLEFGYWHLFKTEVKEASSIRNLKDYKGEETLKLAITQLNTTAKEQTEIVKEWCDFFQHEKAPIKKVFFNSRVSQKIFDSVCFQEQLEGLWIKWGVYPDITNIKRLESLKYLHLGGGASIEDISVIKSLTNLITFETSHLYKIHDYDFLSNMNNLVDLTIEGDPYASMKKVSIRSLKFLEKMPQIIRLSLYMTSIEDHSYLPILKIKSLKYLELPNDKDVTKDIHLFSKFEK